MYWYWWGLTKSRPHDRTVRARPVTGLWQIQLGADRPTQGYTDSFYHGQECSRPCGRCAIGIY